VTSDEQRPPQNFMGEARRPRSYRDLLVWQKSIVLAKRVYELSASFPREEKFGLVAQIRRAVVSIPSNIAEGQARHTTKEFVQFVSHAEGSLAEVDTQLILAIELGYCTEVTTKESSDLVLELRRMLNALRRKLVGGGR
jgi:four helix bundle protein